MDLKRCFEILKLDSDASPSELKQAHRDLVDVWHPDRFSHNPRLRKRAEEELKEINIAYQEVLSFLSLEQERLKTTSEEAERIRREAEARAEAKSREAKAEAEARRRQKAKAKSESDSDIDWEHRILCGDESCTGIIDSDGRCTECGKAFEESKAEAKANTKRKSREEHTDYESEHIDLENRVLCVDGKCIGIIGPDGRCTVCGKRLV
ncbi:J domain-containing protein [bacterium]|nr:J domain-containing protein [bacterium]